MSTLNNNLLILFILKQAGIRCAAVADLPRACSYFKGSLEAHILLYGKMDARTIVVAKLLHSARKGRTDGVTDKDDEEEEDHGGKGEEKHGPGSEEVYKASSMIPTPRAIEVASNAEVAPAYKSTIDLIESKGTPTRPHK